jgi:ABC-type branched-subunit amino acid transport system ATPase component
MRIAVETASERVIVLAAGHIVMEDQPHQVASSKHR